MMGNGIIPPASLALIGRRGGGQPALRCDWLVVGGGWLVVTGGWRPGRGRCQDQTPGGAPAERSAPAEMEMAQYYAGAAPGNRNLNSTNNNVISMKVGHSGADSVDRYLARDMDLKKNRKLCVESLNIDEV